MARLASPLLGYNTNVRHKGRVFHIQTEDSGVQRPHVITHLFADGGRILKSTKTTYQDQVDAPDLEARVRRIMQTQHKQMFIALRDGEFDALIEGNAPASREEAAPGSRRSRRPGVLSMPEAEAVGERRTPTPDAPSITDAAAADATASLAPGTAGPEARRNARRYGELRTPDVLSPSRAVASAPVALADQRLGEKSLDEVILAYLADDLASAQG